MGFFSINKIKAFEQIVGSDFFSIKVVNLLGNRPVQVFQIRFKITASGVEMNENHIFFIIAFHETAGDPDTELFAHNHVVLDGVFRKHQQNNRKNRSISAFFCYINFPLQTFREPERRQFQIIFHIFQFLT